MYSRASALLSAIFKSPAGYWLTMARKGHGRKRRRFNLRRVRLQAELAVGALAADDVVSGAITQAGVGTMRFMSIKANWSILDLGSSTDDNFQFGVAHSDYTAAEIEECLEAQGAIDVGDKVAQEQSNRLVRSIGVLTQSGLTAALGGIQFNDGRPVKTKLNWLMSIGDTLVVWVRNGSANVYTTNALITTIGDLWVKDSV